MTFRLALSEKDKMRTAALADFFKPSQAQSISWFTETEKKQTEREGFEPPDPFGSPVFKTGAIGHSATSPTPPTTISGRRRYGNITCDSGMVKLHSR